jgi:hypothetical protein
MESTSERDLVIEPRSGRIIAISHAKGELYEQKGTHR